MGLVAPDGTWEHHGGKLRFIDSSGNIIADQLDPSELLRVHRRSGAERVLPQIAVLSARWVIPDGMYRVGPLARLNVCRADGHAQGGRRTERSSRSSWPRRGHVVVPVSLRAADRNPRRHRTHRTLTGRSRPAFQQPARRRRHQQPARRRRERSPARHAVPPLHSGPKTGC